MLLGRWRLKELKSFIQTCKDSTSISKLHAVVISSGIFRNETSASQLISAYGRTGDFESAYKLFDSLTKRGIDSWNAMLVAYSREKCLHEVISLYEEMRKEGVKPDSTTFTVAIKACTSMLDLESGEKIWKSAVEYGYGDDIFVNSSVLNLYAKCAKMDEAMSVFERISKRDVVSWSTMIRGFVQSGRVLEALEMFRRMQKEELVGDEVLMLALIQACANGGDLKMACSVHGYLVRKGFPMDFMVQTSLIDMYAKNGKLDIASGIFRSMSYRNVVTWSALISGYAQNGYAGNALELLIEMQSCRFQPDLVSLVSALLACSQVGFTIQGRAIHGYIVRRHNIDEVLGTALIDMYAKCGLLSHAVLLYNSMTHADVILWNTMIASYGIHGKGKEALSLFHQMIEANVKPDHATFASLLSAMSHSGLVDEGQYCFDLMINEYKIQPMEKHYVSLVDILARAGQVEKAKNLIDSMNFEPGIAIWVALLSGCLNHKKFVLGKLAAKKVLELKPESPGIYALISNFFAAARKWDEVAMVRKVMKAAGMKKVPGCSVVEVNGRLHAFLVEYKEHPQYQEIMGILEEMENKMKAMGYIPKTEFVFHNVEEEVKVKMLCNHSERLALAFGILNTRPGTRLLITKNLRVCGDCHEVIKFISVIVKREIILRDMKRFHHFKDGSCSCSDHW